MGAPLALASMGMSLTGGLIKGFGGLETADAQTAMMNYKASVAQVNAAYAAKNAEYALQTGGVRGEQFGLQRGQELGHIVAAQGASGLDVQGGSAKQVRSDEIKGTQEGEELIANEAARKAYGMSVQQADFLNEAQMDKMAAKNIQTAKWFDFGTSLLGGATSVADKWTQYKMAGVFA